MPVCVKLACKTEIECGKQNANYSWWYPHYKYCWDKENLKNLVNTLTDDISAAHHITHKGSMANLEGIDNVTSKFCNYINQACQRTFDLKEIKVRKRYSARPAWYDQECRHKRAEVVKVGERAITEAQINALMDKCGEYRALKQSKLRDFRKRCCILIKETLNSDKSNIWKVLNKINQHKHAKRQQVL